MIAVSNCSPLMWLPKIGCITLLEETFPGGVVFPEAVHSEVVLKSGDRAGVKECREGISRGWLKVLPIVSESERLMVLSLEEELDPGEAEAIVDDFRRLGIRVSNEVYQQILALAGEA